MLLVEPFVLTGPTQDGSLQFSFKRYRPQSRSTINNGGGLALLFVHGVGTHKETWEPIIERIFRLQQDTSGGQGTISEAWSTDAPNHGHAAALNETAFLSRPQGITASLWGRGIQTLLQSDLIASQKVIGIGHSAGAISMIMSTVGYHAHNPAYPSLIIIEPPMITSKMLEEVQQTLAMWLEHLVESVKAKRDIWATRDAAREWHLKRSPWKNWDRRIFDLFITYGFRDLPTALYPDRSDGVTLACTRAQETAGYIYHQDGIDSLDRLSELCATVPVHCILGEKIDVVPEDIHLGVCDEKEGRRMTSITKIPNAGHFVVQEAPDAVATSIWDIVSGSALSRSKL